MAPSIAVKTKLGLIPDCDKCNGTIITELAVGNQSLAKMAAPMCRNVCKSFQLFRRFKQPSYKWRCFCTNTRKQCKLDDRISMSPFQQSVNARKDQAARSILVRLSGKTSESSLLQYCSSHGKVQHCFTYHQQPHGRYALVEFKTPDGIDLILSRAYASNAGGQVQSRFLSFSGSGQAEEGGDAPQLRELNKDCSVSELHTKLAVAESVSEQLDVLTAEQELRDPETRLRFLVCSLIQEAFRKLLPDGSLHLFGSSVNGFGRRSCDMDMFLERNTAQGVIPLKKGKGQYKLGYDRPSAESERVAAQTTLFTLASYLEKRVPHCISVARILQAKCPLLKFRHLATGLSCDLTADNSVALKSSELLHVFSQLDPRVRPLVFVVRHWARHHGITNRNPGHWITNFPLTLLVMFFLQTRAKPVVPSFDYLRSLAEDEDRCFIDGLDCTITGDLTKVTPSENKQTTAELLQEFFQFCTTFNFEFHSLSVRTGEAGPKPDHGAPLYMENPFQTELNMCKNVTQGLLQEIQRHSQYALQMMDVPGFLGPGSGAAAAIHPWGIGALFTPLRGKRNGQRSNWLDGNVGTVLQGLSRKAGRTKPAVDEHAGNSSRTNSTASVSVSLPRSLREGRSAAARTLHAESMTALDASLAYENTSRQEAPGADDVDRVSDDARPNNQDAVQAHRPAQTSDAANCNQESEAARKSQVPKLQITISHVRNRLFNRPDRKSSSWNQPLTSSHRRFSALCTVSTTVSG